MKSRVESLPTAVIRAIPFREPDAPIKFQKSAVIICLVRSCVATILSRSARWESIGTCQPPFAMHRAVEASRDRSSLGKQARGRPNGFAALL